MADFKDDDVEMASARVAIAKAAVDALDDVLRTVRLHRRAADAKYCQRLAEHTQMLLGRPTPAASSSADGGERAPG